MPDQNILTLRQVDQARTDFALLESNLEIIASQLARQPTRRELAQAALGIISAPPSSPPSSFGSCGINAGHRRGNSGARSGPLAARENRFREVTREFQREYPCPATGLTTGACPGYRNDHVVPLGCGGPDAVANMQWQTVRAARAKDRWELKACGR
jgi:hypothetical protein